MNTQQIYDAFKALYKEPSSRFFDESWAVKLMNDAIDDLETELGVLNPELYGTKLGYLGAPSANGGYVSSEQEYDLPVDLRKVVRVVVKDTGGPPYRTLTEIPYWMKDSAFGYLGYLGFPGFVGGGLGEPQFYYVTQKQSKTGVASSNKTIGFVPVPGRNGGSNGVEVVYHAARSTVSAISTSEYPNLPDELHPLLVWSMAVNAAAVDESPRFAYYQAKYQGRLARLLGEGLRGSGEAQEVVETVDLDW